VQELILLKQARLAHRLAMLLLACKATPAPITEMLYLLLEHVWATTRMFRQAAPIGFAKEAARRLVG
jgi:hypothetical protein